MVVNIVSAKVYRLVSTIIQIFSEDVFVKNQKKVLENKVSKWKDFISERKLIFRELYWRLQIPTLVLIVLINYLYLMINAV